MKKLESLNGSLFDKFVQFQLNNLVHIVGGTVTCTNGGKDAEWDSGDGTCDSDNTGCCEDHCVGSMSSSDSSGSYS